MWAERCHSHISGPHTVCTYTLPSIPYLRDDDHNDDDNGAHIVWSRNVSSLTFRHR